MTESTFKGYDVREQRKIEEAEMLCSRMDFETKHFFNDNSESLTDVYSEITEKEMSKGTPANEIIEKLGEKAKEKMNSYVFVEGISKAEDDFISEIYRNMKFDFTVKDNDNLCFKMNYKGLEYQIGDNTARVGFAVRNIIKEIENLEEAINLCERIDYDLNGNPDSVAVYRGITEQGLGKGNFECEILEALGSSLKEKVNDYFKMEKDKVEEIYKKIVYEILDFSYSITDEGLEFSLTDEDVEFHIMNGYDIKEAVEENLDLAEEEHEEEKMMEKRYKTKVEKAIKVCEDIDFALNGNSDSLAIYRETAKKSEKKGHLIFEGEGYVSIEDKQWLAWEALQAISEKIEETVYAYMKTSVDEKDVCANTDFNCNVNRKMDLEFLLSYNDTEYSVENGNEIRNVISFISCEIAEEKEELEYE